MCSWRVSAGERGVCREGVQLNIKHSGLYLPHLQLQKSPGYGLLAAGNSNSVYALVLCFALGVCCWPASEATPGCGDLWLYAV